ncbi:hypothetical protein [Halomonas faecis]|uniref:hypothetical protein n=1 Tax=Halomonas faecis TaxID=1562110 RepID=UPI0013D46156|nr:hypothetical protein [Halomonas faecis]
MLDWMSAGRQAWRGGHGYLVVMMVALWLWSLAGSPLAGWLFLPALVLTTQLIVAGSLETARLRRRAWLGQYLRGESPWQRRLRGGILMALRHQVAGTVLALVLLVKLRLLPPVAWPLLLATALGLALVARWLRRRLVPHVIGERLVPVSRQLLTAPLACLLALALVGLALWLPQPWLVGLGWEEAVARHLPGGRGGSLLAFFERLAGAAEITQAWAMQNAVERLRLGTPVALLGWLMLLATQGAVAWAYVRLLLGAEALLGAGEPGQSGVAHRRQGNAP